MIVVPRSVQNAAPGENWWLIVGLSLTDPSRTSGYQAPFGPLSNGELVVAADDQGHEAPSNLDTLWARNDPQLRVVFGYSSEHSMALTARALIRALLHCIGRPAVPSRCPNRWQPLV